MRTLHLRMKKASSSSLLPPPCPPALLPESSLPPPPQASCLHLLSLGSGSPYCCFNLFIDWETQITFVQGKKELVSGRLHSLDMRELSWETPFKPHFTEETGSERQIQQLFCHRASIWVPKSVTFPGSKFNFFFNLPDNRTNVSQLKLEMC